MNPKTLGIMILALLLALVLIKRLATGSILDKPRGGLVVWAGDLYNLFFLLVVIPAAALLLLTSRVRSGLSASLTVKRSGLLTGLEIAGLALYLAGHLLMEWALVRLGRSFQAGGTAPRDAQAMVRSGPYKLSRHPMYTAALLISLGLACLLPSALFVSIFCIYLALILRLIAIEEAGLRRAYGEMYASYQKETKKLIPYVY
jgi:protein-S-isoprenylcysteine O-methyltransferase Ste14